MDVNTVNLTLMEAKVLLNTEGTFIRNSNEIYLRITPGESENFSKPDIVKIIIDIIYKPFKSVTVSPYYLNILTTSELIILFEAVKKNCDLVILGNYPADCHYSLDVIQNYLTVNDSDYIFDILKLNGIDLSKISNIICQLEEGIVLNDLIEKVRIPLLVLGYTPSNFECIEINTIDKIFNLINPDNKYGINTNFKFTMYDIISYYIRDTLLVDKNSKAKYFNVNPRCVFSLNNEKFEDFVEILYSLYDVGNSYFDQITFKDIIEDINDNKIEMWMLCEIYGIVLAIQNDKKGKLNVK